MRFTFVGVLASVAMGGIVHAGNVVIVDGPAAGTYPSIQQAVDAAFDGDVLLVGPGLYSPFVIDGKALALFATPGSAPVATSPTVVRNVPAGRTVVLSGLRSSSASGVDGLQLANNDGHVRIQQCRWFGGSWAPSGSGSGAFAGGDGIEIAQCAHVTVDACELSGGHGKGTTNSLGDGGAGGHGLRITTATVAVTDTRSTGGRGGNGNWGGPAGSGLYASNSTLFAAGDFFEGLAGGNAFLAFVTGYGGAGGSGFLATNSNVTQFSNQFVRGPGGTSPIPSQQGGHGAGFYAPGATTYFETARTLHAPTIASDVGPAALTLAGEVNDTTYLRVQRKPAWFYGSTAIGPWLVPFAPLMDIPMLGVVPASGSLSASYLPRRVDGTRVVRIDYLQVVARDVHGNKVLSNAPAVLVFDDAAGPDCNGNLVPDAFDIATGASVDMNGDGRPDECP